MTVEMYVLVDSEFADELGQYHSVYAIRTAARGEMTPEMELGYAAIRFILARGAYEFRKHIGALADSSATIEEMMT